jgi:GT2 family glycosyltransferase
LQSLQLCVRSIRENSAHPHQIVVHVNEGSDGTRDWVRAAKLEHTFSEGNVGICVALNQAAALTAHSLIYYLNDDMYCCPGWDTALARRADQLPGEPFVLSSLPVEPFIRNLGVVVEDFGRTAQNFREQELLDRVKTFRHPDFNGAGRVPHLVPREWWSKVGGYSAEFSPGMNSDDDFAMKMWNAGCRIFMGVGESVVYHFISETTGRLAMNDGRNQFLQKWGVTPRAFRRHYLRQNEPLRGAALPEPRRTLALGLHRLRGQIRRR